MIEPLLQKLPTAPMKGTYLFRYDLHVRSCGCLHTSMAASTLTVLTLICGVRRRSYRNVVLFRSAFCRQLPKKPPRAPTKGTCPFRDDLHVRRSGSWSSGIPNESRPWRARNTTCLIGARKFLSAATSTWADPNERLNNRRDPADICLPMTLRRRSSWLPGSKSLDTSGDPCEYECPVFGNSGVAYDERLIPPDRQSKSQTWEISSDV